MRLKHFIIQASKSDVKRAAARNVRCAVCDARVKRKSQRSFVYLGVNIAHERCALAEVSRALFSAVEELGPEFLPIK